MNRIREYRTKRGLTQRELGEMVGLSSQGIANYETGHCEPRKYLIPLLCKALMTKEDKLFPKEEEKQEPAPVQTAIIDGMISCGNATYTKETIDGRNYVVFRVMVN